MLGATAGRPLRSNGRSRHDGAYNTDRKSTQGQVDISGCETHAGKKKLTFEVFAGASDALRWDSPANSWAIRGADIHSPLTLWFYVSSPIRATMRKKPVADLFPTTHASVYRSAIVRNAVPCAPICAVRRSQCLLIPWSNSP